MSDAHDREAAEVATLPIDRVDAVRSGEVVDDEGLEALRLALGDLRHEIRSRLPANTPSPARQPLDWAALFGEARRRIGTLGMVERSATVDEFGMDELALRRSRTLIDFLLDRYWRVEIIGLDGVSTHGPSLFVANRSGLLPYDGLILGRAIERWHPLGERPRFLVADWLITLPFVQPYLARLGGVRACRENADRLLRKGHSVIAFPEGVKGAAKVFRERYRLKRFGRGGVVRAALENGVPLVPVGIVGAEEVHPILFKSLLPARAVGLPFLPVTPTFPLFGPLGALPLPSKWIVNVGTPIDLAAGDPDAVNDELLVSRLTEELRSRVQTLVDRGLQQRESVWG